MKITDAIFMKAWLAFKKDGKYGFIDTSGKVAIPFQLQQAFDFSEGLAPAELNDKSGDSSTTPGHL